MRRSRYCTNLVMVLIMVAAGVLLFTSSGYCQAKHIRFVTVQWEPYYGSKLLNQGYVTEITRTAFKRVGYTMEIDFVPWKRALHDARKGYYNAVLGLYLSTERAKWFTYSKPIASVQLVFFARKGKQIIWHGLEDLRGYVIGIERDFVYTDEFDNAGFLKKEPVRKIELNLKKLLENRIDLVAASRNVFLHRVKTKYPHKLDKIQIVSQPLSENMIYNAFSKIDPHHKRYTQDFNTGLRTIKADGTFDRILQKHGFK